MKRAEPLHRTASHKGPVLNPCCRLCGERVPRHLLADGVCYDCTEPAAPVALSRSVVDMAALRSSHRRGEHSNGSVL